MTASAQSGRGNPFYDALPNVKNPPEFKNFEPPKATSPTAKPESKLKKLADDTVIDENDEKRFWKRDYKCEGETYALVYVEFLKGRSGIEYVQLCNEKNGDCTRDQSAQTRKCRTQARKDFQGTTTVPGRSSSAAPNNATDDLDSGSASS